MKTTISSNLSSNELNYKKSSSSNLEENKFFQLDGGIAILIYLFIVVIFFFTYFFFFGQHLRGWKLILYIPTWIVFFLFIGFKSKLLRKYDTNPGTVFAGAEIAAAQVV